MPASMPRGVLGTWALPFILKPAVLFLLPR